eukprot:scaffold3347_cov382-Prasinococcus_capsulatus_cf.AAC.5
MRCSVCPCVSGRLGDWRQCDNACCVGVVSAQALRLRAMAADTVAKLKQEQRVSKQHISRIDSSRQMW